MKKQLERVFFINDAFSLFALKNQSLVLNAIVSTIVKKFKSN